MSALLVEQVGPLALVEDLGRPGHAAIGVTESGAADRRALRLANRLLGNDEGAPAVEVLLGGLTVRADGAVRVCVTGAPTPVTVDSRGAALGTPVDLRDGQVLSLGTPATGLRTYLAVRGGLAEPLVLGSASTDPTMGLGPAPLSPGRRLLVATAAKRTHQPADVDVAAPDTPPVTDVVLRVVLGPRDDWFSPAALNALLTQPWTVTTEADRVGVRLAGPPLDRADNAPGEAQVRELPSEAVVRGAVQVPHAGQPLVFLADHPTTGGYPVMAVVVDEDTDVLAQLRPGDRVRFRRVPRRW